MMTCRVKEARVDECGQRQQEGAVLAPRGAAVRRAPYRMHLDVRLVGDELVFVERVERSEPPDGVNHAGVCAQRRARGEALDGLHGRVAFLSHGALRRVWVEDVHGGRMRDVERGAFVGVTRVATTDAREHLRRPLACGLGVRGMFLHRARSPASWFCCRSSLQPTLAPPCAPWSSWP
jgi:hypothetical protein